jgi:hypothetical protein
MRSTAAGDPRPQEHVTTPQAQPAPAVEPARQTAVAAPAAVLPDARPQLVALPVNVQQAQRAPRPGYAEMVAQLEPMIQAQLAEVMAVIEAKGIKPGDVNMVYAPDITGDEVSVCLACGFVGHNYQPTLVRTQNPEIDMLTESVVVFLEVASRAGINHGLIAYDDQGVIVLREVKATGNTTERGLLAERFQKFRDRYGRIELRANQVSGDFRKGKVVDQAWLQQERAAWKPSDASRKVAGEPDDKLAVDTLTQLLAKSPGSGAVKGATLVKSQTPRASVKSVEAVAKAKGIVLSGIAVGKDRDQIRRTFFRHTAEAANMHALRESVGAGINKALAGDGT